MKMFAKLVLALAITASCSATTLAASSTYHYGEPKKIVKSATANLKDYYSGYVTVYNNTSQTYLANATFYPSGISMNDVRIDPYGWSTDVLTYDIAYPDTSVCISIRRYIDNYPVLSNDCRYGGYNLYITYGAAVADTAHAKPIVTIRNKE